MDITVQELKERMDKGEAIHLIDVREPYEHEEFNIGGLLCPLGDVMRAIEEMSEHKAEEIVVYCRSGRRSDTAKQLMQQAGYQNVRNLLGGMLDWQEALGGSYVI
ncbi:MAG: rhodanese-like domain-containing protein [Saprospiraceae bacterium]|nr:rhodanese-like domain-containing protein [Saprospiraceae bacterium]